MNTLSSPIYDRLAYFFFCTLVVLSDPAGDQSVVLRGKGKQEMGSFWAHHVSGSCMNIALQCDKKKDEINFEIDDYVAGYPVNIFTHETATNGSDATRNLRVGVEASFSELENPFASPSNHRDLSVCGADNKRNAVCYRKEAFKFEYRKARAVARLYINGSGGCTGWVSH
jgi:hypothetical protein